MLYSKGFSKLLLVVLALVFSVFCYLGHPDPSEPPEVGDGQDYDAIAFSISIGKGYGYSFNHPEWRKPYEDFSRDDRYELLLERKEDYFPCLSRPPLFPVVLSVIYSTIGRDFQLWRILGASLFGGTILLISLSILKIKGLLAAIVVNFALGLDFILTHFALLYLTEILVAFFLALFVYYCLSVWLESRDQEKTPSLAQFVILGVLLGAIILTRSQYIVVSAFLLVGVFALFYQKETLKPLCLRMVGAILSIAIILSPWITRNLVYSDGALPFGTMGARNLVEGFSDEAYERRGVWSGKIAGEEKMAVPDSLSVEDRSVFLAVSSQKIAFDWIKQNPSKSLELMWMKVENLFYWNTYFFQRLLLLMALFAIIVMK